MHLTPRESLKRFIFVIITAIMVTAHLAPFTTAQAGVQLGGSGSGNNLVADCKDYPGISSRIVKCVRETLTNSADQFFAQFYPLIARAVTAFITLGVVIYGVMMAMGMVEKIGRDSMVLLLKVAFVAYFVQNVDMLYDWVLQAMDSLSASMFTFATVNHPTAPVCMVDKSTVWERLDCLLDTLFGIRSDVGSSNATSNIKIGGHGLVRGMIAFFGSALVSSVPGFIIGLIGFMFMYTMLFFVVKVLFTFLAAYMMLVFLMIFAPIFIPMVIFRASKQYFDNWVRLVVSAALQPVIIVTFVSFAVAGIDIAVFSGDKSFVRTIAGDAARQNGFNLNEYIESKHGYVDREEGPRVLATSSRNEAENTEVQQGVFGSTLIGECGLSRDSASSPGGLVSAAQECAEGWIVGVTFKAIDWEALAEARSPAVDMSDSDNREEALMKELYASAILTAVMIFIMNALMRVVPQIANDMIGSYRQTPNIFGIGGGWQWQQQGSQMAGNAANQMRQAMAAPPPRSTPGG